MASPPLSYSTTQPQPSTEVVAVPVFAAGTSPTRATPSYQIPSILTARLPTAAQGAAVTLPHDSDVDLFEQALASSQRRPPMVKDGLTEEAKLRCRVQIETKRVDIRRYEVDVQKTGGKGSDERHAKYLEDQQEVTRLVHTLRLLLLRGGAYTMRICQRLQQAKKVSDLDFQGVIDINMHGVIRLFRLQDDGPPETFYIQQVARCERRPEAPHVVRIDWTNGKHLLLALQENEVPECIDVLRVQEDRYQKRREENIVKLSRLWLLQKMPFDPAVTEHRTMLLTLWQTCFPDTALEGVSREQLQSGTDKESLTSSSWNLLGFQGRYPPTDFRAMGMLSLYNMLYLAETRQEYLQQLLAPGLVKAGRQGGERDYPWATAAINVTALMMKLLNVSDDQMHVHISDPSWDSRLLSFFSTLSGEDDMLPAILATWPDKQAAEDLASWHHPLAKDPVYRYHEHAFEETFCFLMNVLDTMFMDAGATYMDFPIIFQRCEAQLMQWLAVTPRPTSIQQLYHFFLDGEASQTNKARHAVAVMPVHVALPYLHRLVDHSQDPPWLLHYRSSPTHMTPSTAQLGAKSGPSSPQGPMDGGPEGPKVVDIDDYRSLPSSVTSIDRPLTATKTRKEVALELIHDAPGPDQRSPQKGGAWTSPFHRGYPLAQLYQRRTSSQHHEKQDADSSLGKRPTSADQVIVPPRLTLHLSEVERDVLLPDFDHFTFQEEGGQHAMTAPTSPIAKSDLSGSNKQLSLDRKPKGPRPLTANRGGPS